MNTVVAFHEGYAFHIVLTRSHREKGGIFVACHRRIVLDDAPLGIGDRQTRSGSYKGRVSSLDRQQAAEVTPPSVM